MLNSGTKLSVDEVKNILNNLGYKLKPDAKGWRTNALYRGGDNETSVLIYKDDLTYHDFVTGQNGKVEDLIKIHNGESFQIERPKTEEKEDELDEKFDASLLELLLPNYSFFNKRSISNETLKLFKGGFCNSGKLNRRYVFPIFDLRGQIIGFSGRTTRLDYKENNVVKWKHLGRSNKFIYPCHVIDNELDKEKKVILVESIGDALALHEMEVKNVLVLFGLKLSPTIINYLTSKDINQIIISTNNDFDSKRGNDAASKFKKKLDEFFDDVRIKLPPDILRCKDWGDILINHRGYNAKEYFET